MLRFTLTINAVEIVINAVAQVVKNDLQYALLDVPLPDRAWRALRGATRDVHTAPAHGALHITTAEGLLWAADGSGSDHSGERLMTIASPEVLRANDDAMPRATRTQWLRVPLLVSPSAAAAAAAAGPPHGVVLAPNMINDPTPTLAYNFIALLRGIVT